MNHLWNIVSSDSNSFDVLLFLAASAVKATFLLGFVALLCLLMRRFPAAIRHLLWTLSLCAALLLPFLSVAQVWEVRVLPAQISAWSPAQSDESASATDDAFLSPEEGLQQTREVSPEIKRSETELPDFQPAAHSVENTLARANLSDIHALPQQGSAAFLSKTVLSRLAAWALAIWLAGAVLLLFRLAVGLMASKWLTRGAVEFQDQKLIKLFSALSTELQLKGRVRLLCSERTLMPIVCGVLRPVVLLPASVDDWPEERRRMVLLHELTHVTRRDCLTQMLAQAACAFYWFNPFVWHAAWRLRVERERACDDYVLNIGTKPSDYAHHLLEIARYLQEHSVFQWSQTTTVAMARRSQLEGRLLAILSKEGKRRAVSQLMTACLTTLMLVLFLLLAVMRPATGNAQNPQVAEAIFHDETDAAEQSPFDLFSTTNSELKDEAIIHGSKTQEQSEVGRSDAIAAQTSQEKISNRAQISSAVKQYLKTDGARVVDSEVAENTTPRTENFPVPGGMPERGLPAVPFIKVQYQEERKTEAQDKAEDFIDEMASVGYANLTIKELLNLKATGVTADYVRSLHALGLNNLTPKEISGMSVNGVAPAFIEVIREAGYKELNARELLSFRLQGVTPELINRLRTDGYSDLSAKQLIEFAIHQVTPEFIDSMRAAGFGNLSARELVTLRVQDITPEFVRDARKRLGDLTLKQIIALKVEGLLEGSGDE